MGIDVHLTMIPPGVPTPLPNPFMGMVLDMFAWLPFIGATVMINGLPAAQAGTEVKAIPPHLPLAGPFAPPLPGNEGEIFMGSATVVVDGAPQARMGVPVLSCHSIGMPAPIRKGKKGKKMTLFMPTSVLTALPKGRPVMIGGPLTIDIMSMAMHGLSGLGKLAKRFKNKAAYKRISQKIHDVAGKVTKKLPTNARNRVHRSICDVIGHPVDVGSGKVYTDRVDFILPGPIPLVWERVWFSTSDYDGPLGHGWHHAYDLVLKKAPDDPNTLVLRLADGRNAFFQGLSVGQRTYLVQEKIELRREKDCYLLTDDEYLEYAFAAAPVLDGTESRPHRISNPSGAEVLFTYNTGGTLSHIKDSAGRDLGVASEAGRITAIHAPHPGGGTFPIVRFAYDQRGNLVRSYDELDHAFTYEYAGHLLGRETDRNGLSFYFEYDGDDASAWCIRTWGDDGIHDNTVVYDKVNRVTSVTNSRGAVTVYEYNEDGLVTRRVDAYGAELRTEYGHACLVTKIIDENGYATRYTYNEDGHTTAITFADETQIQMSYDQHLLTMATDQNGGNWQWLYNDQKQLTARRNAEGVTSTYEYAGSDLTTVIDPAGNRSELTYDAAHNLAELRGPDASVTQWRYDVLGRVVRLDIPTGGREELKYNLRGDLLKVNEIDGNVRRYQYDGEENPTVITDRHRKIKMEYGGMSRLTACTENDTRVEFLYDTEEDLTGIVNEHGYAYRFKRDRVGRVTAESSFDGVLQRYVRDAAGRVTAIDRSDQQRTVYELDKLGRTTQVRYPNGQADRFAYREDGQLLEAENSHATIVYERDKLGRTLTESSDGTTVVSTYDQLGMRTTRKSSLGSKTRFRYNKLGDLKKVVHDGEGHREWKAEFTHDQLGLEIERRLPGGSKQPTSATGSVG